MIADEMELDDEEAEMLVFSLNETTILRNGITFHCMGSRLMTGTIVTGCMIKWRSQEVRCFMTRCTCSM
jgi:hypothetical protein